MKNLFACLICLAAIAFAVPAVAQNQANDNNSNPCITTSIKDFYPGQSGSETLYMTNHCNYGVNVDIATSAGMRFLVQLNAGDEHPTGVMFQAVHQPYQYWYCPMPQFPSNPKDEPQNGPKYGSTGVVCRK